MTNKTGKFFISLIIFSIIFSRIIFAAEGDIIWTRTYNGPANDWDFGYSLAVDGNGNVYVTGFVTVSLEYEDIWVRKYNSEGDELWTRTHNGTANRLDEGYGIAVDGNGNVYITGCEDVIGQGTNIWVRKYNTEGDVVWTDTYNGTANQSDCGEGIAVDGNGNVYVTGSEYKSDRERSNIWVRKYDTDGDVIWTRSYNGPANDYDEGCGIAVDGSGNVYVTGSAAVSLEHDDIWVRKYNSEGDELWTQTHNDTANRLDEGSGIAVDGNGNVYVTGYEYVNGQDWNIWVRKYDSDGNELWTRTHNGTADSEDAGCDIAVDGDGNVYVVGYEADIKEALNIWLGKYDSDGNKIWTRTYNGPANDDDEGYGIAVDKSGNIYVTGCETVTGESFNIWVRKYEQPFGIHFKPPKEGKVKVQGGEKGYVNPLKGEVTKIHFKPSSGGTVRVKIFTLRGLLVWEKSKDVSGIQDFIEWNCRNKENSMVASGIYVIYVEGPGIKSTKKVAILK